MNMMNQNNEVELLPCPFCGGEAYYLTPAKEKGTAFETMRVECRKCGAVPFAISVYEGNTYEQKKQAIARQWNRRANSNDDNKKEGQKEDGTKESIHI